MAVDLCRQHMFIVCLTADLAMSQAPIKSRPVMRAPMRSRPVILSEVMFLEAAGSANVLFMLSLLSVFFFSELHDKGQAVPYPGTGQQTVLGRPADFAWF